MVIEAGVIEGDNEQTKDDTGPVNLRSLTLPQRAIDPTCQQLTVLQRTYLNLVLALIFELLPANRRTRITSAYF